MSEMDTARLEEMLDWLAEEVAARLRVGQAPLAGEPQETAPADAPGHDEATTPPGVASGDRGAPAAGPAEDVDQSQAPAAAEPPPDELPPLDTAGPPSHAAQLLSRLAIGLLLAIVLINIPLGLHGLALARMIPSSASLVVRNGLLVKESGKPEVYVYQDGKFRWITDLEAFQHYGYQWKNVHEVAPGFLEDYALGKPLSLVAKCPNSPHVYRLQNGIKHWIVDIPTFEAEGYQWSDVQIVDCYSLAAMPMGETIPPGHGPAPQP